MLKTKKNLYIQFIKSNKSRQLINLSFLVTVGDRIYRFQEGQDKTDECNHEEADTTIILLAHQVSNDVAVIAKDTDDLVLLI